LADGHNLPSEWTNKYDIVCSNFGVIYFSQVNTGLSEMVKCTKPGGKVCFSAWEKKEMSSAFRIFPAAVKLCGLQHKWMRAFSRNSNEASFFLPTKRISADRNLLHGLMRNAGLRNVHVIGPFSREVHLNSAEEYWHRFVLACPNVKRVVEHFFTDSERESLKETVMRLLTDGARNESESASSAVLGSECHDMALSPMSLNKMANATSKVAIADSGATHHLWPDYSAFISYQKVSNRFVSLADKSTAPIVGIGDIAVSLGGKNIVIRNVYHVPSLRAPLYSLRAHRRLSGCGFMGDNDCFQICFPTFSLTVNDDIDSYIEYLPLGKKIMGSEDYIQPRSRSSRPVVSKNGCITFSASAFIAFGTKE
jgi:ubiquinone/menaquinone biosynthesis C-methylase UbiE